ncbi:diaminopimelate decarboxylase [Actinomadura rubrobrunea]|uniref:Diaminopimelate decarboxylase n=2 Tax=Actinomadura rubrobrunea TaxID=115335 RepID=A0A9W6PSB4_9ACTN|nr:diaminopimelate decarboxylase [Actinomadura rubrobrunea]
MKMPPHVLSYVRRLGRLPAYVYDLPGLRAHAEAIRNALRAPSAAGGPELYYAAKANADAPILRVLDPFVDGIEISSGGELVHVRRTLPHARLAFGGPGKTDQELRLALDLNVDRIHVESPHELHRIAALDRPAGILLRANLPFATSGAALSMSGPFGMDEDALETCAKLVSERPWLRLHGIHAHLASGLHAPAMLDLASRILDWALPWLRDRCGITEPEVNVGGGMAVDYTAPDTLFDWRSYAEGLASLTPPGVRLRIEPGRAVTAYHGWYVTDVLDVKNTRGDTYVVLRGGTHHLRTPVTKGHDQPFVALSATGAAADPTQRATLVGQLCTPKDVFARDVPVPPLEPGDVVAFAMAGAYAWNISHHDFLMHPKPDFHYIDD